MYVEAKISPAVLRAVEKTLRRSVGVGAGRCNNGKDSANVNIYYPGSDGTSHISMEITQLPGCCGVAVVHDVCGPGPRAATGMKAILELVVSVIAGAGAALYTTIPSQVAVIKALKALAWTPLTTFTNPSSTNEITLWIKKL